MVICKNRSSKIIFFGIKEFFPWSLVSEMGVQKNADSVWVKYNKLSMFRSYNTISKSVNFDAYQWLFFNFLIFLHFLNIVILKSEGHPFFKFSIFLLKNDCQKCTIVSSFKLLSRIPVKCLLYINNNDNYLNK